MAWNFQNLKHRAEKISARCFFNEEIRFGRFDFEFEAEVAKKFPIVNHRRGEPVTSDWATKVALDPCNVLDVIDMPVCQKQKFRMRINGAQPFTGALGRIEENRSLWRLNEKAIRFENAPAKALVFHCDLPYPKRDYG